MAQRESTTTRLRQSAIASLAGFPERRVMLVSDNRDALESDAVLLAAFGQWLQRAYDGPSALHLAKEFEPQIVFLDLDMTGGSGAQIARQLRKLPCMEKAAIIAYAGPNRSDTDSDAFDYVFSKPIALSRLFSILRNF